MADTPGAISIEFDFRNQRFLDAEKGLHIFTEFLEVEFQQAQASLSKELRDFLDSMAELLAQVHGDPWPGGTTPKTLSVRSGSLIASIIASVKVEGDTFESLRGYIGAGPWGTTHEYGAVIKAKNAKYLTIPLRAALDSRGLPLKAKARDWKNTFVAKTKNGNLVIFQKVGTTIVPLYVLRTSVTIPPRLNMQKTLETNLPYFIDRAADAIVKAFVNTGKT
jgi:hypothetical protein